MPREVRNEDKGYGVYPLEISKVWLKDLKKRYTLSGDWSMINDWGRAQWREVLKEKEERTNERMV